LWGIMQPEMNTGEGESLERCHCPRLANGQYGKMTNSTVLSQKHYVGVRISLPHNSRRYYG